MTVYDRCEHGGIRGTMSVYDAAIRRKDGSHRVGLAYLRSSGGSGGWTGANLIIRPSYFNASRQWYDVYTDGNIGMTRTGRITWLKMSSYLVFSDTPGAARNERCEVARRSCRGYFGW
ncbi:hypothetical protein [Conexibacter woesei]|uniref:Uncharacterized protein n=1 Tax=Conexibacter woesei (strain DSM 14684 / CCUG 47730 / CIP 108061 / JCM 11494 / NBRC 100937 / ID131577) TaxID=469383 RepID=D3EZ34_CONWI|nr:hypothetical protein [Conexibacter woesei]ADB49908.1 hypothetical protein Cwoe_1480 [Conexibacter woesei DSM 14684]